MGEGGDPATPWPDPGGAEVEDHHRRPDSGRRRRAEAVAGDRTVGSGSW